MNKISRLILAFALLFSAHTSFAQVDEEEYTSSGSLLIQGSIYELMGKYDKAITNYKKCHPNDTNYAYTVLRLASAYNDNHDDSLCLITAQKGLTMRTRYEADFYQYIGMSYREMTKYDEAHKTFDEGIAKYPYFFYFHYQKGLTYVKQKKYSDAVACFQKSIELNQYHKSSHFQLGKALVEQGRMIPALLAFEYYLVLDNTTERANKVVVQIEDMYGGNLDSDPEARLTSSEAGDQCFDYLVDLIESKKALNPDYKNLTKLKYKFVMQRQLMFETMKYEEDSKNWFMQTYVPFFVGMQQNGHYVAYTYYTLATVADKAEAKGFKKNKKKINAFAEWATIFIDKNLRHPAKMAMPNQDNVDIHFHDNKIILGIGKIDPSVRERLKKSKSKEDPADSERRGEWTFYQERNGLLRGKGRYDDKGKEQGEWVWYFTLNGVMRQKANYVDGKMEGVQEWYFDNGSLRERAEYKNGKMNGSYVTYRSSGAKYEEGIMKDDKLEGKVKSYFTDGTVRSESEFKNGERDGETKEFFSDGSVSRVVNFLKGKENGAFLDYSETGKLIATGQFTNGVQTGHWITYYSTGEKVREGDYNAKGDRVGSWKEFHRNGELQTEATYGKDGKLNGELYMYDSDGIKYNHNTYKAGIIQQMRYYAKDGDVLLNQKLTGQRLAVIEYHPNGSKAAEGELVNNLREGEWKFFREEGGWLESKFEYKRGLRDGASTTYHANGRIESKGDYKDDMRHGFFKFFHSNGQLSSKGWYQYDERQSEWVSYNGGGVMTGKQYFLNGGNFGNQYYYDNKGRMVENNFVREGWMRYSHFYDSTGTNIIYTYRYDSLKYKGEMRLPYPNSNGKLRIEQNYLNGRIAGTAYSYFIDGSKQSERPVQNGDDEGLYKAYYLSGQLKCELNFHLGSRSGISKWYHENGKTESVEKFVLGVKDDTCFYYHENGQLRRIGMYRDGEPVGEHRFYSPEGELSHIRYYDGGALVAYSYNGTDGKLVPRKSVRNGNGDILAYFANGNKSIEGKFENGYLHGAWKEYYASGAVFQEENFEYGDYDGVQKIFYANGKLMELRSFKAGFQHLEQRYFHENGQVKRIENWVWDDLDGEVTHHDENGTIIRREVYHDDNQLLDTGIMTKLAPPPAPPKPGKPGTKK
ncbi:MAG: tetratricopeptide repeat protein [Bacteroidia bacterium]|nr:tetratricopeptide repeat protein [Bacteroidia bacterium]